MATAKPQPVDNITPVLYENMTDVDIALYSASALGWRPEIGDTVNGTVIAVKTGVSTIDDGPPVSYPIVVVLPDGAYTTPTGDDTSAVAVHGFHSVMLNEFVSQKPQAGDHIFVKRLGTMGREAKVRGQSAPELYAVHVARPNGEAKPYDWGQMLGRPTTDKPAP
jgi:hypothetical protein